MSNVRHRIFVGAKTVVDIDDIYSPPEAVGFTMDRTDIFMDSTFRKMDENPI